MSPCVVWHTCLYYRVFMLSDSTLAIYVWHAFHQFMLHFFLRVSCQQALSCFESFLNVHSIYHWLPLRLYHTVMLLLMLQFLGLLPLWDINHEFPNLLLWLVRETRMVILRLTPLVLSYIFSTRISNYSSQAAIVFQSKSILILINEEIFGLALFFSLDLMGTFF